jgi:hypothetical protein
VSPIHDHATAGPGRVLTGRAATLGGIALGVLLVAVLAAVMVVGGVGAGEPTVPTEPAVDHDHEHVEVDPLTDRPIVDPCDTSPDMCGVGAGTATDPCADPSMCGPVIPGGDEVEIDAGAEACTGELCGDIGPGEDDDAAP